MSIPRPPRRAVGHLDGQRREAILIKAETLPLDRAGAGLSELRIFGAWSEAEFLSDLSTALVETAERYGLGSNVLVEQVQREARRFVEQGQYDDDIMSLSQTYATPGDKHRMALRDHGYRLALLALPDPEFLTAIEHTVAKYAPRSKTARVSCETLVRYVDAAMRAHAVPFAANPDGQTFRWVGDPVLRDKAVAPALHALADRRLAVARAEFADALVKRRAGRASDMRDAVHEAANATESVMEVLLSVHGVPAPNKKTASALFNRLADPAATSNGAVLPGHIQQLALAAAEIRNYEGGHSQGTAVSAPSAAMVDAAIGAAASAITVLATYLDRP
jgi:hypothetical protein